MDRLQAIRLFVRVVDLGSFSKAAADLGIGQPSATKQVAQMEKELGARLLHRSTHGVSPTEIGALYYEKCKLIVHHADEADDLAALLQSQVQGGLRINTSVAFGRRVVVPLTLRFMELHPELQIDLSFEDRYVDLIEQGVDLAVRMGQMADSTLGARYLGSNPWLMVAAPAYLRRHGQPPHANGHVHALLHQVDVAVVEAQVDLQLGMLAHEADHQRHHHAPPEGHRSADAQLPAHA